MRIYTKIIDSKLNILVHRVSYTVLSNTCSECKSAHFCIFAKGAARLYSQWKALETEMIILFCNSLTTTESTKGFWCKLISDKYDNNPTLYRNTGFFILLKVALINQHWWTNFYYSIIVLLHVYDKQCYTWC